MTKLFHGAPPGFIVRVLVAIIAMGGFTPSWAGPSEPLYPIINDGHWGLINARGDVVLAPEFDQIGRGGSWIPETWDAVNPPGQVLVHMTLEKGTPVTDEVIPVRYDGQYALATRDGELLVHGRYEKMASDFRDGRLEVTLNGLKGFIDESGQMVVPPRWEAVRKFSGGYAFVREGGRWGIIDRQGKVVVPPKWDEVKHSGAEWGVARLGAHWGVIDWAGNLIVPFRFDAIRASPMPPLLPVISKGRVLYVRPDGEGSVAFEFRCPKKRQRPHGLGFFKNPVAVVKCGDKYGVIDQRGAFVLEPVWDDIKNFKDGRSVVTRKNRQGLIDETGRFVIAPEKDLRLYCCEDGMVGFRREGVGGYMDLDGKVLFTIDAERVGWFSEGLVVARRGGKDGFVDRSGAWVIEPRFHRANVFHGPLAFVEQPVRTDLLEIGYINRQGDVVARLQIGGFIHSEFIVDPAGIRRRR